MLTLNQVIDKADNSLIRTLAVELLLSNSASCLAHRSTGLLIRNESLECVAQLINGLGLYIDAKSISYDLGRELRAKRCIKHGFAGCKVITYLGGNALRGIANE